MTSPIPTEGGHTPGPWEVCGQFVRTPFRHGEPGAAGLMIADVRFGIWPPEQHEANARLIAAAPALLEALRVLVPTNIGTPPASVPDGQILPVDMTVGELRKAIAALLQATGGENGR